jgi:hypothetical protein
VCCDLAAWAGVRVPVEALAELRKQPGPSAGLALPAGLLKHADEQTVAAVAAVFHAVHDYNLWPAGAANPFTGWAVLAAPRFLGRQNMTSALPRFREEGAWGVSPHLIPHRSLHSPSGTLSQALQIHGPNHGVGGGPGSEAEGLLAAVAQLLDRRVRGVWVAFSRIDPDHAPENGSGIPVPGSFACGLALALALHWPGARARLVVRPEAVAGAPLCFDTLWSLLHRPGRASLGPFGQVEVWRRDGPASPSPARLASVHAQLPSR